MQEQQAGRKAARIATLLSHYFRPEDGDAMTKAIASDWMRVLGGVDFDLLDKACIRYLTNQPRRRPTPGDILNMANGLRPKPDPRRIPAPPEPDREPKVTAEAAERIMREHGFNGMKVQRMPRPRNMPHTEEPTGGIDVIEANPEALEAARKAKREAV